MTNHQRRNTHHSASRRAIAASVTAAALAGAVLSTAPALADPEQGGVIPQGGPEQGGVVPESPQGGSQGGVTPAPAPAPAPTAPTYNPGPGSIPSPPQEAPYQPSTYNPGYQQPNYPSTYNPVPTGPITPPKPTAPVRPIAPPPQKLRIGNYVTDIPKWMNKRDATSINEWAAYGEAKIAQGLISIGVPKDQASRQAAATIIGVALGGATGATVAGVPAAVVGGVGGAVVGGVAGGIIGGVVGSGVPPFGLNTGPGVAIGVAAGIPLGAAAGAALLGIPAAVAGAVVGGTIGGVAAWTLGAGDPGANPKRPTLPGQPNPDDPQQANPAPGQQPPAQQQDPGPAVMRVNLPASEAQKSGLPAVDYQVNVRGDVNASVTVGAQTVRAEIPAEIAKPAYNALGPQGQQAAATLTQQATTALERAVPGMKVQLPQPKHAAVGR